MAQLPFELPEKLKKKKNAWKIHSEDTALFTTAHILMVHIVSNKYSIETIVQK